MDTQDKDKSSFSSSNDNSSKLTQLARNFANALIKQDDSALDKMTNYNKIQGGIGTHRSRVIALRKTGASQIDTIATAGDHAFVDMSNSSGRSACILSLSSSDGQTVDDWKPYTPNI